MKKSFHFSEVLYRRKFSESVQADAKDVADAQRSLGTSAEQNSQLKIGRQVANR